MLQLSLFSNGPTFRKKGRKLIVTSSRLTRLLSLGLFNRTMTVDPDRKVIVVRDQRFWFDERVERYPFDLITGVSFHLGGLNHDPSLFTSDRLESYSVGLKLYGQSDPDVHLFRFVGEGRMSNNGPLPDWVYWYEDLTDIVGTHEEEAQHFVKVLGWVLMKPIVPK
jgi:hypothetical protein